MFLHTPNNSLIYKCSSTYKSISPGRKQSIEEISGLSISITDNTTQSTSAILGRWPPSYTAPGLSPSNTISTSSPANSHPADCDSQKQFQGNWMPYPLNTWCCSSVAHGRLRPTVVTPNTSCSSSIPHGSSANSQEKIPHNVKGRGATICKENLRGNWHLLVINTKFVFINAKFVFINTFKHI